MKHTKKSLFITTIMMVVLLVAALSTATFAWYTSSNTVNTQATDVNSALATGANIAIGWSEATPAGTRALTFNTNDTPYSPMVPELADGAPLTNTTKFVTAIRQFGQVVPATGTIDPYIGANPEESSEITFYIVNYATVDANIDFTSTVTGENAARLRLAVFNASTGDLVYTNAQYDIGQREPGEDADYELLTVQPASWGGVYANYFEEDGDGYKRAQGVAPAFDQRAVFKGNGEPQIMIEPTDWKDEWTTYSSTQDVFTAMDSVAPAFEADKFYKFVAATPETLKVTSKAAETDTVTIALSNGVSGTAQGFIVKAWFDGTTQVDAFGGQKATFTLTVTAG